MSRTRQDIGLVIPPGYGLKLQNYNYQTGEPTSLTNYGAHPNAKAGKSRWCTDEVTTAYRDRIKSGEVIINPVAISSLERMPTIVTVRNGPHPYLGLCDITGDFSAYMETYTDFWWDEIWPDVSRWIDMTVTRAHARIDPSVLNPIETLKDLDSTIGMLRKPFSSAWKLLGKMHVSKARRLRKSASNAAQVITDTWLEYRYGWRPLIGDVENVVNASHKIRAKLDKRRLVARAEMSEKQNRSCEIVVPLGSAPPGIDTMRGVLAIEAECKVSAGVVYDLASQTTIDQLNQILGTRPSDLASNIWQSLPYSFVLDWFVNVDDWLRAITPDPCVSIRGSWVSVCMNQTRHHKDIDTETYSPYPDTYYRHRVQGSTVISRSLKRYANPALPKMPVMKSMPLTSLQTVDGVSLMAQKIIGSFQKFLSRS